MSVKHSNAGLKSRTISQSDWVRPLDWLTLPDITGQEKIVMLVAVFPHDQNYLAVFVGGDYTVDWGDGTVTQHLAVSTAQHQYSYSSLPSDTSCSRGYRQVVVTITPQEGQQLTRAALSMKHSAAGLQKYSNTILDVCISGPNFGNIDGLNCNAYLSYLEQFRVILYSPSGINLSWLGSQTRPSSLRVYSVTGSTGPITNMDRGFTGMSSLTSITLSASVMTGNTLASAFQNCNSLTSIPKLVTASVTNFSSCFANCYALKSIPDWDFSNATTMNSAFAGCSLIQSAPTLSLSACTDMSGIFSSCSSLLSVPQIVSSSALTSTTTAYQNCYSLASVGGITNTSAVLNAQAMFNAASALQSIPSFDFSAVSSSTNLGGIFTGCASLSSIGGWGSPKYTLSVTGCRLSTTQLYSLLSTLARVTTAQTITITNNVGSQTVSLAGTAITSGSSSLPSAPTTNLSVGMLVTGTGISTTRSVTFQDAGDTVTLAGHGLQAGATCGFTAITSTTGILINTPYYVVNPTSNTFQVASTQGGPALPLTTDGSGILMYPTYVTALGGGGTGVTLSVPASATGTQTLVFRTLDTSVATLRGWVVAG